MKIDLNPNNTNNLPTDFWEFNIPGFSSEDFSRFCNNLIQHRVESYFSSSSLGEYALISNTNIALTCFAIESIRDSAHDE